MKEEYLNVSIVVEITEKWFQGSPFKISDHINGIIPYDVKTIRSEKNSCMILRDREALGTYERFFKEVTKLHYVMFEQEFHDVFFDNELDGIIVEKTMVSEELYTTVRLVITN